MSQRSHITALFLPLNSPGHINGSIAIADRLSKVYEYKCVFVTLGEPLGDAIESRGHTLIVLEEIQASNENGLGPSKQVGVRFWSNIMNTHRDLLDADPSGVFTALTTIIGESFVPKFKRNFHQYERVILEFNPDLIVIDNIFAPPFLLKNEHKYPWVRIHSSAPTEILEPKLASRVAPVAWMGHPLASKEERELMRKRDPEKWQALLNEWRSKREFTQPLIQRAFQPIYDYFSSLGLADKFKSDPSQGRNICTTDSPYLNIYLYPEALDYVEDDDLFEYPKLFMHCNSLIRETVPSEIEQRRWVELIEQKSKGKMAKILFSLGSIASGDPQLVERFLKILGDDLANLYIVSTGLMNSNIKLNEANMIGGGYIPQPFLLQHVDLAIIHGGNNGITECLHHGVPVIVAPLFGDQFDIAQRVVDKKVGQKISIHACTKEQLFDAIETILVDQELRARVRRMGEKMRARDDLARLTNLLHKLATEKKQLGREILIENNVRF